MQNDQRAVIGAEVAHRHTMCSLLQIQHCALMTIRNQPVIQCFGDSPSPLLQCVVCTQFHQNRIPISLKYGDRTTTFSHEFLQFDICGI